MEFEERRLIDNLIKVSNKDANRDFILFNGFGTLCHGRYFLGGEGKRKYYIMHSFIVVCYIPLFPVDYMIGYKSGNKKYIIGNLNWQDIKEYVPQPRKIFFYGALDGIVLIICLMLFILFIFSFLN